MSARRWKRGKRRYDFGSRDAQAIIFGAQGATLWAWAVWGHKFRAEGVEFSLQSAKKKADAQLDRLRNGWVSEPDKETA
jgi:hypothetical protein